MRRSTRQFLMLLAAMPLMVLVAALLYMAGMHWIEEDPRDFWRALAFAAETITTTGYGIDGQWRHPAMVLFVITLQFIGVIFIYMVVPMFLVPFLEERFEGRLPRTAPPDLRQHVLIYRWGPAVESLVQELTENGTPTLILEHDETTVRRLVDRQLPVLFDDSAGLGLDKAYLEHARALIANGSDEANATFILVARQMGFEGECLALVEEPYHRRPLTLAGATAVLTPRHVLGAALAARASRRIHPRVSGLGLLGKHLEVDEIRVASDSPGAGSTLAEAQIGARTGAIVIGRWNQGHLETQPTADWVLEPGSILVVVGTPESHEKLLDIVGAQHTRDHQGSFLVAGFGVVGRKITQLLRDAGESVEVLDLVEIEGVDRVGDVLDPNLLESLELSRYQGVVLALDDDRATLFATVILRDQAPKVPIIARVNAAPNVDRIHHAGADFALSISHVSGTILARRLLGEESIAVDTQLKVLKTRAPKLVGKDPLHLDIRQRTGCSLVAVEHDGELRTQFDPGVQLEEGDTVFICGPPEAVAEFRKLYG